MDIEYTASLYYKKYPYKISLQRETGYKTQEYYSSWNPSTFNKDLESLEVVDYRNYVSNFKRSHRIGTKVKLSGSIFLKSEEDFKKCLDLWKDSVVKISKPKDDNHLSSLQNKIKVIFKPHYFYKKYQYSLIFSRYILGGEKVDIAEVKQQISDMLGLSTTPDICKLHMYGFRPKLYLKSDNELALITLTYGDIIREVTKVELL